MWGERRGRGRERERVTWNGGDMFNNNTMCVMLREATLGEGTRSIDHNLSLIVSALTKIIC